MASFQRARGSHSGDVVDTARRLLLQIEPVAIAGHSLVADWDDSEGDREVTHAITSSQSRSKKNGRELRQP